MIGKDAASRPRRRIICGVHSSSILARSVWKGAASAPCMMRGPGCAAGESGPSGGGGISALINWCPNPTTAHVTPDHPAGQPRRERLIDHAAIGVKTRLAARHEFLEPHVLRNASALGLQHAHDL